MVHWGVVLGVETIVGELVGSIPLIVDQFPQPQKDKAVVRIAAGAHAFDESLGGSTGGDIPFVHLYDLHGDELGHVNGESQPEGGISLGDGESVSREIETQGHPEYLKLTAYGLDAVCIAYVTLTAPDGKDFLTWNGDFGKECGIPWYPSPQRFPGVDDFRPNCIWLSKDNRFVQGVSLKLTDFSFPTSEKAAAQSRAFHQNRDLLCDAPGRMQFWKETEPDSCIPYYPLIVHKTNDGTDGNLYQITKGHKTVCDNPGTPFNDVDLFPNGSYIGEGQLGGTVGAIPIGETGKAYEIDDEGNKVFLGEEEQEPELPEVAGGTAGSIPIEEVGRAYYIDDEGKKVFLDNQNVGGNAGQPGQQLPDSTTVSGEVAAEYNAISPRTKTLNRSGSNQKPNAKPRRQDIKRRQHAILKARGDKCVDQLVISDFNEHSARAVCESTSSYGPDFLATNEGLYCDMCEHQLWPICDDGDAIDCFDIGEKKIRFAFHASPFENRDEIHKEFKLVSYWK